MKLQEPFLSRYSLTLPVYDPGGGRSPFFQVSVVPFWDALRPTVDLRFFY